MRIEWRRQIDNPERDYRLSVRDCLHHDEVAVKIDKFDLKVDRGCLKMPQYNRMNLVGCLQGSYYLLYKYNPG